MHKKIFSTSPYKVGTSGSNSLALVIPAQIVREQKIDTATIFLVKQEDKRIILEKINFSDEKIMPADKGFQSSGQQVS
jgi:hypothetical protein